MVFSKLVKLNHVIFEEKTLALKWTGHLNLLSLNSLENAGEMPTLKWSQ